MGFFSRVDDLLRGGAQVLLDAGTLMPGGNLVNGAQAVYHGAHALHDLRHGEYAEAVSQAGELAWHTANTIPGIHHALHPVHVAETLWDAAATLNRWAGEPLGKLPNVMEGLTRLLPFVLRLGAPKHEPTPVAVEPPAPVAAVG